MSHRSEDSPFLVVGLGNPGDKYANTRHNLGFRVVDELAFRWGVARESDKFQGRLAESAFGNRKVLLLKPMTYMNRSGLCAGEAARFFKLPVESSVLVLTDDLDIPAGSLRLRMAGGPGGHNGLKSLIECFGTEKFARVRLGIGRSPTLPADAYVLAPIPKAEQTLYDGLVRLAADAVEAVLEDGIEKAMNVFNKKTTSPEERKP